MTEEIKLESLQKKVALLYFEDGLWDMAIGYILVAFGIGSLIYDYLPRPWDSLFSPLLWLAGFISFLLCKRLVVFPRLGIVKARQSKPKKSLMKILVGITALLVVLTITVVFLTIFDVLTFEGAGFLVPIIFGLIPLSIFSGLALILNYYKLFIHAVLFGIAFFMNEVLRMYNFPAYGDLIQIVCGLIIIALGISSLVKFLKKYPLVDGVNMHD